MKRSMGFGCATVAVLGLVFAATASASGRLTRAELASLRDADAGEIVTLSSVPLDATRVGAVRVRRVDVYAPGARVLVAEASGLREIPRSDWRHYVADVRDPEAPLLAFSLAADDSLASGMLMTPEGTFALEGEAANGMRLRVGTRSDRAPDGSPLRFTCNDATTATDPLGFPIGRAESAQTSAPAPDGAPATRAAVIAVDTDNELLLQKFSNNTTNATNYIAALFAQMNLIYERDLDLVLQVGTTILRPSTTPDPFSNNDNVASQAQLVEFGTFWQNNQAGTPRVLAMLLSGKSFSPNGSSGIAWVLASPGSIYCNLRNGTGGGYSVSQVFKFAQQTAVQDTQVVSHELGHNFGVAHTHCTTAAGTFPSASGTLDQCYRGEGVAPPGNCYASAPVCPGSAAGRTLMSYCHLPYQNQGLGINDAACGEVTLAFHPVQITSLLARIASNVPACITPVGSGEAPLFVNGFE